MRRLALLAPILLALVLPGRADAATPILGKPATGWLEASYWAIDKGATKEFAALASLYWLIGEEMGVRPDVAYVQAAKETNWGRYTGVLDASFKNPCGLKTRVGGPNHAKAAHKRFRFWGDGVRAHLDHLALYAGKRGYPKKNTHDPRHFAFLHRKARSVEALGGKWAPSRTYGTSVAALVREIARYKTDR